MKCVKLLVGVLALVLFSTKAEAGALEIFLDDGVGGTVLLSDNGASDLDGTTGFMTVVNQTIGDYNVRVTFVSSSSPAGLPQALTLNVRIERTGTSTASTGLTVRASDIDYALPNPTSAHTAITVQNGTVAASTVDLATYYDENNVAGAMTNGLNSLSGLAPTHGSGEYTGTITDNSPVSLTLVGTWNTASIGTQQFDMQVAIPEPGSLLMLSGILAGMGGVVALRRRRQAK